MRVKTALFCLLAMSVLFSFNAPRGECWEDETHIILTDAAAWKSLWFPSYASWGIDLNEYLRFWHGIGVNAAINGKPVRDWIQKGAFDEDTPVTRSFYHFHDPLKPWNKAGLSAMSLSWKSSILWSQTPLGLQSYSWKNARQYYYRALSAPTDSEREQAYALMFQALGHIMHLVEDAAVPDHTRNDAHIFFSVEKWASKNNTKTKEFTSRAVYWDVLPPIFDVPDNPLARVKIAGLFDTDQYTGENPEITASPTIGIAEYSNANFLSKGTIFTYEHPAPASTELGSNGKYLRKFTAGEQIEHFLSVKSDWPDDQEGHTYTLDDQCHEDYAKLLLPKAAQYAAAVLQYFFRAVIDCLYAGGDDVSIYNDTDEVMADGTIEIYAHNGGSWIKIGQAPVGFLGRGKSMIVAVNCDPYYHWEEGWTVVFRGTLGEEKDAVMGNRVMFVM